jgi:RHS repeat-associated protein
MMQASFPYDELYNQYSCALLASSYTGKERDTESGLDYFGARYYGSSMGRFMSPDWADDPIPVPYANLMNPQSLNLYSYVGNNPLSSTDEDGHQDGGALPTATCDSLLCRLINLFRPTPAPPGPPPPPPPPPTPAPTPTPTPAPPNSRTDVVLASDEIPVKALAVNPFLYTTTWYAFGFNNGALGKRQTNAVITLDDSMNGGPFRRTGDPSRGSANDQLMSGPPVDQRWSVDGQRVRLVTSRDKDGKLVLTWQVHVVRGGSRPSYSSVP